MLELLFAVVGLPFILTSVWVIWENDGDDEDGENEDDS